MGGGDRSGRMGSGCVYVTVCSGGIGLQSREQHLIGRFNKMLYGVQCRQEGKFLK